jgi:hypothetical protein
MSPSKGTSKKPTEVKNETVNVSWRCPDCDDNTTYNVTVSGIEGNKHKENPLKNLKSNSASFKLPGGKYKITVSGTNGASSDTTYIVVKTGGGTWFLVLLLLAAAGVGGYFLLKKMKNRKPVSNNSDGYSSNKKTSSKNEDNNNPSDDGMF